MPTPNQTPTQTQPGLVRVLGLRELIIYGLILVQPTAPMPLYGIVAVEAHGHVVTAVLIAMVAMLFTAMSYGRMARIYPHAGSAYAYVGRELHPSLGYLTGWSMMFDYIMNPIICVIWCSKAVLNFGFLSPIPYTLWVVFFAVLFTVLNLRGIKSSARTNACVAAGLGLVIVWFFAAFIHYLFIHPELRLEDFTRPFYDPKTFSLAAVASGTSLAVLTYIGFDAISTLSEEAHNPRRNILLATVWTCLLIGLLSAAQVYAAQVIWPSNNFADKDTAFVPVAGKVGGQPLFHTINLALLIASIGSGMGALVGASRLLYGMGRDHAIPHRFFAAVNPRTHVPSNNIILVGVLTLIGAFTMDYDFGASLLNFGALVAFMGVNICAFTHYYVRGNDRRLTHLIPPLLGFAICFLIWLSLNPRAKLIGLIWLATGFLYGAWRTDWYRRPLAGVGRDETAQAEEPVKEV